MGDSCVFSTDEHGYHYNRSSSSESSKLSNEIATLYSASCTLATSGMNAIALTMSALLGKVPKDTVVFFSDELYCDTPKLLRAMFERVEEIDVTDREGVLAAFTSHVPEGRKKMETAILFLEGCSNPTGKMMDPALIKKLRAKCQRLYVIVDNTWLSVTAMNPFNTYDADIVIVSLSKYYSAGTHIGGAILTRQAKLHSAIARHTKMMGVHISPLACKLICDNITSLSSRVIAASKKTVQVARALQEKGYNVNHLSLASHPCHEMAQSILSKSEGDTIYPSVFTVVIDAKKEEFIARMTSQCSTGSETIPFKTSFGSGDTRVDSFPQACIGFKVSFGASDTRIHSHPKILENGLRVRIAIGYDSDSTSDIERLASLLSS